MHAGVKKADKSDQRLVQEIRKGNKEAFETLFFCYHLELCGIAAKITESPDRARDIIQNVFLRLWRSRETWEVNKSVKSYLYQAVWNEALNAAKKDKSRNEVSLNPARHSSRDKVDSKYSGETSDLIKKIWGIVDEMSQRRRMAFTLHRKHGLTYKEIAEIMQVTRKTVENHIGLALKEIRESIEGSLFE